MHKYNRLKRNKKIFFIDSFKNSIKLKKMAHYFVHYFHFRDIF